MTITEHEIQIIMNFMGQKAVREMDAVDDKLEKTGASAKKASKGWKDLGKVVAGFLVAGIFAKLGQQLLQFGKDSIQAASDVEEMRGKFEVVFGDTANQVEEELGQMGRDLGRSKTDLMGWAATLQDTFVPLGFAREQASEMSTELVALALDLAAFNNVADDVVIRDLQSALVGNTETLRKYGIVAQETQIKQEALNTGLWDGKGAMDAQTKAQAILQLATKGSADAQGTAAREAEGYASKTKALEAATMDLKVAIGAQLLPTVVETTTAMTGAINQYVILLEESQRMREVIPGLTQDFVESGQTYDEYARQIGFALSEQQRHFEVTQEGIVVTNIFGGELAQVTENLGIMSRAQFEALQTGKELEGRMSEGMRAAGLYGAAVAQAASDQSEFVKTTDAATVSLRELTSAELGRVAIENLDQALEEGKITGDQYREAMVTVGLDLLGLEPAQIRASFALEEITKDFQAGETSAEDFIKDILAMNAALNDIPEEITVDFNFTGDVPGGFGGPGGNGRPTGGVARPSGRGRPGGIFAQHGLDMVVPPGFQGDNFPVMVSSGERVQVTPAGQLGGGGISIGTIVFQSSAQNGTQVFEEFVRILSDRSRTSRFSGSFNVGM